MTNPEKSFIYTCDQRGDRPSAVLAMHSKLPDTLMVANVFPRDPGIFTDAEYNAVLDDFTRTVLERTRVDFPFMIMMGSDALDLRTLMPAHTFELLKEFSAIANRSTGSGHPVDREIWYAFLVSVHNSGSQLKWESLVRWLVESEKWPVRAANLPASEFEFALGCCAMRTACRNCAINLTFG